MNITFINISKLHAILLDLKEKSLPIKTTYKLYKLFESTEKEFDFYSSKLQEIILTYAIVDEQNNFIYSENGSGIKIQKDKIEIAQKEINELESIEIDLPDIQFTLEELESLNLTISQIKYLKPFIKEEQD